MYPVCSVVVLVSCVHLFVTPWPGACQVCREELLKKFVKGSGQGFGTEQSKERVIACPQETQVILFISVFGRIVLLGQKGWGKGSSFSSYLFCGAFCIEFLCA